MALVVPNAWQMRITWSQGVGFDHQPQNVLGLFAPSVLALTQTVTDGMAAAIDSSWTSSAQAGRYQSTLQPEHIEITDIRSATGPQFEALTTATSTGTGDPLPAEIAVVTSLLTALRGKSFRGRFYWPAPQESQNGSDNRVSSTFVTGANTFLGAISVYMASLESTAGVGVISRALSQINKVTVFNTNTTWDTQRRRGLK